MGMEWFLALIFRPLGALILFGGLGLSIRYLIHHYMKDGWLKRQLLAERLNSTISASHRKLLRQKPRRIAN